VYVSVSCMSVCVHPASFESEVAGLARIPDLFGFWVAAHTANWGGYD